MKFQGLFERSICASIGMGVFPFLIHSLLNFSQIGVGETYLPIVFFFWFVTLALMLGVLIAFCLIFISHYWEFGQIFECVVHLIIILYTLLLITFHFETLIEIFQRDFPLRFSLGIILAAASSFSSLILLNFFPKKGYKPWIRYLIVIALIFVLIGLVLLGYSNNPKEIKAYTTNQNFVFIGLDGLDWTWLKPLMEQGKLSNIQKLYKNGVRGDLKTIKPTSSPVLWTTMATGRTPHDHGITGFGARSIIGHSGGVTKMKSIRGFWLEGLMTLISDSTFPVNSSNRTAPAYWNLAGLFDQPSFIQNWWVTWPAESIKGLVVSDRIHFRGFSRIKGVPAEESLTHPKSLFSELVSEMLMPTELSYRQVQRYMDITKQEYRKMMQSEWRHHKLRNEFKYILSMFKSNRRIAKYLLREKMRNYDKKPDFMMLFRFPDLISHTALKYSDLAPNNRNVSFAEHRKYNRVFTEMHKAIDDAIGNIIDEYGAGNVILVSDHGFKLETNENKPDKKRYHHKTAPDGIFIANGPVFGSGDIGNISIYDIFPLLATLKGFPIAKSLEGVVPMDVFADQFRRKIPQKTIKKYPDLKKPSFITGNRATNREIKRRLKALGYLQ